MTKAVKHEPFPDEHNDVYSKTTFGFWLYLISDFMLFATIFAAYLALRENTFGGPGAKQLFNIDFTVTQTLFLLCATFTSGLGGAAAHRKNKGATITWFLVTFVLGLVFFWMQLDEFTRLTLSGNGMDKNAFLSGYFTLVGTHALHMFFALLWVIVLIIPVFSQGLTPLNIKRLTCLRMFWQFLNVIWVFIFSVVYVLGVI